jgi:benzoyl-CoA reductase/2-hydroxyglutaryl-CoA dehydratase subunit BcrC/BadD/HgdB
MLRELSEDGLKEFLERVYLIDESRVEEDMRELSYKYAELGVMLAKVRAEYESKKLEFQVLEANLAKHFRETLHKVTEKAVEEAIIRTIEWQEAKRQLIEAKQEVDLLSALVQALEAKRDILITYLSWKKELVRMNKEVEF